MRYGWLLCLVACVYANVEKTIFSAPADLSMTSDGPTLDNLCLQSLTPNQDNTTVRVSLPVSFPSKDRARGQSSWYLLQQLRAGQRYEVRICWSATQPTDFRLTTHEVTAVFNDPNLLSDLSNFSNQRQTACVPQKTANKQSVLFLKVDAAADYRSSDPERMRNPPDVLVDIILDPYLYNIVPQSLLQTGAYIILLIPTAVVFSGYVWRYILDSATTKTKVA